MGGGSAAGSIPVPIYYGIPFIALLLGIATLPIVLKPHTWEKSMPFFVAACCLALLVPFGINFGGAELAYNVLHSVLEYLSFIALIFSLYSTAGGIVIEGAGNGTPMTSALLLGLGAALASIVGTTGASMLLVRPLLRSVKDRKYNAHAFIFFIFLVSNIGGALTPIGDPPVFLGFLMGIDFFYFLTNLILHWLFTVSIVLVIFLVLDTVLYNREMTHRSIAKVDEESELGSKRAQANWDKLRAAVANSQIALLSLPKDKEGLDGDGGSQSTVSLASLPELPAEHKPETVEQVAAKEWHKLRLIIRVIHAMKPGLSRGDRFAMRGWPNAAAMMLIIGLVVTSGYLNKAFPDAGFVVMHSPSIPDGKAFWSFFNLGRDVLLLAIGVISWLATPKRLRRDNNFSWMPFYEVAVLFIGIFIALQPILLMFGAGIDGALGFLVSAVNTPTEYFWATGGLASFLDNAPTFLVFFNLAGGDAEYLMGAGSATLKAITIGAVFMGANTYIGNAPNLLVLNVAKENGIKMPGFFGYMLWSLGILGPIYVLITVVFFPWW